MAAETLGHSPFFSPMSSDNDGVLVATIARIFQQVSFKRDDTRITANTLKLTAEYIKLFVSEAVTRSNEERLAEGDLLTKVDGIDDLEKDVDPEDIEARVPDTTMNADIDDMEDPDAAIYSQPPTQLLNAMQDGASLRNDTLDTRHLQKVAGVLVLDF